MSLIQCFRHDYHEVDEFSNDSKDSKNEPLSRCEVILLNVSWFGLSLMMIVLSVEGKILNKTKCGLIIVLLGMPNEYSKHPLIM